VAERLQNFNHFFEPRAETPENLCNSTTVGKRKLFCSVLVVSTSLPEITAILRDKFLIFFILVLIIALVIIGSSILLHYLNTRRIRAEEAQRFVENKEQLQSQIDQATKLASIGELIDSVAHEINTPVSIISVHTDSLKFELADTGKNYAEIQVIKEQTRRIGNYIRTLLNYSRRMPFNPEPVDLTRLIDECLYLLGHRFRARQISIEKKYATGLPTITLDYRQMEQVFINLLNNAVDAIPTAGTITIGLSKCAAPEISGVALEISDTGEGIPPGNLPEIFKPFFSTKLSSKGTGLGLSISKAIIQRHQGQISVTSEINQGTTFRIFLPLHLRSNEETTYAKSE
jgi:two-component system cell cycle sensor histidine kinase/response regulator CckA